MLDPSIKITFTLHKCNNHYGFSVLLEKTDIEFYYIQLTVYSHNEYVTLMILTVLNKSPVKKLT